MDKISYFFSPIFFDLQVVKRYSFLSSQLALFARYVYICMLGNPTSFSFHILSEDIIHIPCDHNGDFEESFNEDHTNYSTLDIPFYLFMVLILNNVIMQTQ